MQTCESKYTIKVDDKIFQSEDPIIDGQDILQIAEKGRLKTL